MTVRRRNTRQKQRALPVPALHRAEKQLAVSGTVAAVLTHLLTPVLGQGLSLTLGGQWWVALPSMTCPAQSLEFRPALLLN